LRKRSYPFTLLILVIASICFSPVEIYANEPRQEITSEKNIALHTYGGGELFKKVFNAISMLIYGNSSSGIGKTFNGLLRIALVVGGFCVICLAFFREKFEPLIKFYFLPSIAITGFLLVPRTSILIQDHLIEKTPNAFTPSLVKVDNVPFFLGKLAMLVSTLSYEITNALESVSHGVNDQNYNWTGHIYAGDLLFNSDKCQISHALTEENFREFCHECVFRDIGLGLYTKEELIHSHDILDFLEKHTSKLRSVRFRESVDDAPVETGFIPCHDAIKRLNKDLKPAKKGRVSRILPALRTNTKEMALGELSSDVGFLLGQSRKNQTDLQKLIKQQAAIDILKEELPGTMTSFNAKKAQLIQRKNQKLLGSLGAKAIVAMRNFFEALIYMVFPLLLIVSLLSFGIKPLVSWLQFILWVNIWPPFFVVVNFLLNSIWDYKRSQLFGSSVDFTIYSSERLFDLYSSMEAIAAMAMAFIPFLSWALLKGGVSQMVHLASSLNAPAQSSASQIASEAVMGNSTQGNVSIGSTSAYNRDVFRQSYSGNLSQGSLTMDKGSQSTTFVPNDNQTFIRQNDTTLREGITKTEVFNRSLQNQQTSSDLLVEEKSQNFSSSLSESTNNAVGLVSSLASHYQSGDNVSLQNLTSEQQSVQEILNTVSEYSQMTGLNQDTAVREMMDIGLSSGAIGSVLGVKGGISGSWQKGMSNSETIQSGERGSQALSFVANLQKLSQYSSSEMASILSSDDLKSHEDFSKSWNETQSSAEQLRAAHSQQETYSMIAGELQSENLNIHKNLNQQFVDYLKAETNNDMGIVSKIIDAPSTNPQKSQYIDDFVQSLSHKMPDIHREDPEMSYQQSVEEITSHHPLRSPKSDVQDQLDHASQVLSNRDFQDPTNATKDLKEECDQHWQYTHGKGKAYTEGAKNVVKEQSKGSRNRIKDTDILSYTLKESTLPTIAKKISKQFKGTPKEEDTADTPSESITALNQSLFDKEDDFVQKWDDGPPVHWNHYPSFDNHGEERWDS